MKKKFYPNPSLPFLCKILNQLGLILAGGLLLFSLNSYSNQKQKNLILSEQDFLKEALSISPYFKKIKLENQKRSSQILQAKYALSNWSFISNWNQTEKKNPTIDSFLSQESQTKNWNLALQKKIPYGLSLSSSYANISEKSVNASFLKQFKPESIYRKNLNLELKANLTESISHFWLINSWNQSINVNKLSYQEQLEDLAIKALKQYWTAYNAWVNLKQTKESLKTYRKLVLQTDNKIKYNFLQPGERPQILAEYQNIQKLKDIAKQNYEKEEKALLIFLKKNPDGYYITFKNQTLKKPPNFSKIQPEQTRIMKIQKKLIQNQKLKLKVQQSSLFPSFELIGRKGWMPADTTPNLSFSSAPGFYEMGLSLKWIVFSKSFYERVNQEKYQLKENEIEFEISKQELKNNMKLLEEQVKLAYKNITRMKKANNYQKQAFRELKNAFNQGRVDIFQLIQTEKQMRASEVQKINSMGEYSLALASLQALRDELLTKYIKSF